MTARQGWLALALALVGVGGAFWLGRSTAPVLPARVEIKTVEVEKAAKAEKRAEAPARVTTTTKYLPPLACPSWPAAPPSPESTTVVEERGAVTIETLESVEKAKALASVTTAPPPARWMVGASYGLDQKPGALVAYRLVGPVWLGASADLGGNLRASLAVTF